MGVDLGITSRPGIGPVTETSVEKNNLIKSLQRKIRDESLI